jgi:hypothetical protein
LSSILPEHAIAEAITQAIDYAEKSRGIEADKLKASPGLLAPLIENLVEKYGHLPTDKNDAIELANESNIRIIGMLFMPLSDTARADVIYALEKLITMNVCPVLVGLVGEGIREGLSMAWPLPLALARYVDAVIKE